MKAMNSRPIRPTSSRKSNFLSEVPRVIYSQSAADFRPPADYVGPKKSLMERPPDPSMNPRKNSLPVLSVSKLNVQMAVPTSSKTSLPNVEPSQHAKTNNRLLECQQVRSILRNMPQSFRKQFRSELQKKRPVKGNVRRFVYRDFHEPPVTQQATLHGIVLLRGNHRDMVEEVAPDPGTPPPLSGRRHCIAQTDTYLEDIADNETGFVSAEMQCDPTYDEPLKSKLPNAEKSDPNIACTGTQLDHWVFPDIAHTFDQVATNLADAVIMESLKQLQEEFELEALRKQHEYHKCLRNREMSLLAKYKSAQEKHEQQKRYLDSRKPWDETLDQIIKLVGFDRIRDIAPLHFIGSQTDQAVYEHVQETMMPPINAEAEREVARKKASRNVIDDIIEESVIKREAEFAGKMYIRDPKMKGSLATESPSRQSIDLEEWLGELDEEFEIETDTEIHEYPHTDGHEHRQSIPTATNVIHYEELKGEGEVAYDATSINSNKRRSSQPQEEDDDDD